MENNKSSEIAEIADRGVGWVGSESRKMSYGHRLSTADLTDVSCMLILWTSAFTTAKSPFSRADPDTRLVQSSCPQW